MGGLLRLLLATIGGVEPIIARVGGDNLGGGVVPEEFAGLDGGQACREIVLLPWEVIAGFGGRVEGKIRGFVPVTIGGLCPIKAGGVEAGLGAMLGDFFGSNSTGMLRSMLRVVCLSFLGGFVIGGEGEVEIFLCCLGSGWFIGPMGLDVVSLSQGTVGAFVVSYFFLVFSSVVALRGFNNHSAGVDADVPGLVSWFPLFVVVVSRPGAPAVVLPVLGFHRLAAGACVVSLRPFVESWFLMALRGLLVVSTNHGTVVVSI